MGAFDDIPLEWAGKPYLIPAHKVLGAIARVEDVLTLNELQAFRMRGGVPMAKLSQAYGVALRYAGAAVTDTDVYLGMFQGNTDADAVVSSIQNLIAMMIPPAALSKQQKDTVQGNGVPAASASSKRRTKSRSASGK